MPNKTPKPFKDLFYELSNSPEEDLQTLCRLRIIQRCQISRKTFYNWVNGETRIPALARTEIAKVLKNYYPEIRKEDIDFAKVKEEQQ